MSQSWCPQQGTFQYKCWSHSRAQASHTGQLCEERKPRQSWHLNIIVVIIVIGDAIVISIVIILTWSFESY